MAAAVEAEQVARTGWQVGDMLMLVHQKAELRAVEVWQAGELPSRRSNGRS